MKRICILCNINDLQTVQTKMKTKNILSINLSENGKLPVTHKFCSMLVDDIKAAKLLAMQDITTIELSEPSDFLTKWNLQIIK